MKYTALISALSITLLCSVSEAAEVKALCVDTFQAPMNEIVALYQKQTGNTVSIRYDKAGRLFGTILNENPVTEVIFTQDMKIPGRLVERGKAVDGTEKNYASAQMAVWSNKTDFVKGDKEFLAGKNLQKIAILRPNTNVYGKNALQVMDKMGVAKEVEAKMVKVDTVPEAVEAVKNGSAQAAFVDLGMVSKNGKFIEGSGWILPADMYKPIAQGAILLNPGSKNKAAEEFLKFVTENPEARKIVNSYGYK